MAEHSEKLEYVRRICAVTGKNARPDTEKSGVAGTDLGIPFADGDDLYLLFGDTFPNSGRKGDGSTTVSQKSDVFLPERGFHFPGLSAEGTAWPRSW